MTNESPKPQRKEYLDEEGEEQISKIEGEFDPEEEIDEENLPEKIRKNNYPPEEQR